MSRRIVAFAFGVVCVPACGDGTHPLVDASSDSRPNADAHESDAANLDAFVDPSLILRYDFEDSSTVVKDGSSRGKDGTVSDVAAWTADGRNGRGVAMVAGNPATRYVTLPSGVLTDVDDFTISVWIKYNGLANFARIFDFGNGALGVANHWMFLTLNDFDGFHASSFDANDAQHENILATNAHIPTGVWKHVTLTGSGGNRQLYIDGFPVGSSVGSVVPPKAMEPTMSTAWLGRSRFEVDPFKDPALDATLDDFRIYNRVLTTPEVADLAWPQRDYAYWRFDEASGMTAKDSSDNAIPTALANGPTWVAGRLGGAIDFAGGAPSTTGPQVTFGSPPLAACTTQLTVAVWVKMHALSNWSRIFDFGTPTKSAFTFLAPTDGAGMHFAMVSPNGVFDMVTPTPPLAADDTWHHVAVTVDPAALVTIYIDGAPVMTQTNTTGVKPQDFAAASENWLGKSRFTDTDAYLNGALDELRISCRAFTADEIKNLSRPAAP